MTDYSPAEFYQTPNLMDLLIHPEDRGSWSHHLHLINEGGQPESFELRLLSRDNRVVWFQHICAPVYDEKGSQVGVRSTNLDITQRKESEAHIERMAYYDPLTELPNRRSLVKHIRSLIDEDGKPLQRFAVLFLDLSRFKNINDSFGHSFGDRLLKLIAERLRSVCGKECLVSRFGGDEFIILIERLRGMEHAAEFAKRLLQIIEQPLELDGIDLHVSASVGISFYPEDGKDEDTLIRNADVAMYKTKKDSSGNIRVYSVGDSDEAARFVTTESNIQKGIKNDEFIPFYQPKVDMRSGRIIGMGALARWQHPVQGLISPGELIPVAEETGQINVLGGAGPQPGAGRYFALAGDGACRAGGDQCLRPPVRRPGLLQKSGADHPCLGLCAALLEVEITEQVFLEDIETAAAWLRYLRSAGLTIALDDFGTGYSSFNYIKQLPINTLKIDRSFITHIDSDKAEYAIIKALVSLCRDMRLNMVVEGVETSPQREALVSLGCDKAQGFHFYRSMSAEEVERLLLRQGAAVV